MLVITDEEAVGIGREGGLAGAGKTKEESDIILLLADIGRRVEGKLTELDGLEIVLEDRVKNKVGTKSKI
jgi:hypothetical protein